VAQAMEFAIGATASCPMVCYGGMSRMTVDSAARTVTHLVIEPKRRRETHRLVPFQLVDTRPAMRRRVTRGFGGA
jgi:hypothetical protein